MSTTNYNFPPTKDDIQDMLFEMSNDAVNAGYNLPSLAVVHAAMPNLPEGYTISEVAHVHSIELWSRELGYSTEEIEADIAEQNIAVMEDKTARKEDEDCLKNLVAKWPYVLEAPRSELLQRMAEFYQALNPVATPLEIA